MTPAQLERKKKKLDNYRDEWAKRRRQCKEVVCTNSSWPKFMAARVRLRVHLRVRAHARLRVRMCLGEFVHVWVVCACMRVCGWVFEYLGRFECASSTSHVSHPCVCVCGGGVFMYVCARCSPGPDPN